MKIYAGSMSIDVTESDLRNEFKPYGEVSFVNIVKDRSNNSSRGFAFVEMPNDTEGAAAITALNGKTLKGKAIVVNEAMPKKQPA